MVRLLQYRGWRLEELRVRNIATMLERCARDWRELRTQSVPVFAAIPSVNYASEALNDSGLRKSSDTLAIFAAILRGFAGSLKKRTSWAVPRFFGITQRIPITVVVALTEDFGLVMLDFFSVRSGNDPRDIVCWRCFFRDRWVSLQLYLNCPTDCRTGIVTRVS